MEASTSPLRQIPGYSILFGFLILLASGTLGEETTSQPTLVPAIHDPSPTVDSVSNTASHVTFPSTEFPTKKLTNGTDSDVSSEAHSVSKSLVATSSNKTTSPARTLPLQQLTTPKHSEPDTTAGRTVLAALTQAKQADATKGINTSAKPETATPSAKPETATPSVAPLNETETTKVVGKSHTTVGESTSLRTTAATVGNTGLKPRSSKGKKEMSTTPGQHVQEDPTARDTSSRRPDTQYTVGTSTPKASEVDTEVEGPSKGSSGVTVMPTEKAPHSDPQTTASPAKDSKAMTVAIVLSILLLMLLLLAFLLCWRRRRSGSTSFKMAGWAGQAALVDDSALDKELDQGAPATGEGETRRATLTTFFGKRQSRVPSVAMEEIVHKETGDIEEAQHLLDGDASGVSSPEGSGEANGKFPEPPVQCSPEKEFPPPPANQEETPPTKLEEDNVTS